jgi:hypothetical protein
MNVHPLGLLTEFDGSLYMELALHKYIACINFIYIIFKHHFTLECNWTFKHIFYSLQTHFDKMLYTTFRF